ncbi:MAG: GNAT family N-acetyltransferase [Verrucomicrobiaceae bacterium]|nr:MAG: GNAT family N-acetyltransferase [Verrucomicrobiaceae bacterium]
MKLVRWRRFTWDLSKLPQQNLPVPSHYTLRIGTREDARAAYNVISSAFSLDTAWSDTFQSFRDPLNQHLEAAFAKEGVPALVITHGQRIIAASALSTDMDADSNLISGPCVLVEYRNRGLGTALLYASLVQLKNSGLSHVRGICKDTAPTSKFVYPKFGSTSEIYSFEPTVVGS